MTHDEMEDHAVDLFFDAKFTELLNYAQKAFVPMFWKQRAVDTLFKLKEFKMTEAFLQRYVEILVEACPLEVLSNSFYVVPPSSPKRDPLFVVRITVERRHLTEGGRLAEAFSDMNLCLYDELPKEYFKYLKQITFRVRVDEYDEEEDDFEPEEDEDEDITSASYCECPECTVRREEEANLEKQKYPGGLH